jgi:hypothetical protein
MEWKRMYWIHLAQNREQSNLRVTNDLCGLKMC